MNYLVILFYFKETPSCWSTKGVSLNSEQIWHEYTVKFIESLYSVSKSREVSLSKRLLLTYPNMRIIKLNFTYGIRVVFGSTTIGKSTTFYWIYLHVKSLQLKIRVILLSVVIFCSIEVIFWYSYEPINISSTLNSSLLEGIGKSWSCDIQCFVIHHWKKRFWNDFHLGVCLPYISFTHPWFID